MISPVNAKTTNGMISHQNQVTPPIEPSPIVLNTSHSKNSDAGYPNTIPISELIKISR